MTTLRSLAFWLVVGLACLSAVNAWRTPPEKIGQMVGGAPR